MPRTTLFRQLLQRRHLTTYEAFSARFERAATRLADLDGDPRLTSVRVSPRQFDRWYGGELQTLPRPDACRVLEHMLGRPVSELFSEADDREHAYAIDSRSGDEVPGATELRPRKTRGLPPRAEDENPLDIVSRTRQLTTSNADETTLAFLGSSLEGITARYELDGPYALRAQTRSLRQLAHTLLDGRQPPRARRELFRLAARASGLLGYMAVNMGDFALAEAYCTEARELSREIDDTETELWADGTLSFSLYYAGRYADADACAAAAVDRAPRSAQSIRLLVNGRARALGKMRKPRAAAHAIGQALELSALHDVPAGVTPCISFEPYGHARTLANAVTTHVSLGNVDQVLSDAQEIDDLVEHSDSTWSRSLVRLDVSAAVLQQASPDLDHAMSLGREALVLCGDAPIRSVWQRARELYEQAMPWRDQPSVREYGDELRAWSSQPAALVMSHSRAM
jgi:tetratricopeptide (TPR) repeat protein